MLSTTHSLTSALIVTRIPSPFLSFPLIIINHYLLDAIPHWDTGTGLSKGLRTKKQAFFYTLLDLLIAFFLVYILFQKGKKLSVELWLGVMTGIFPDLLEAPATFIDYHPSVVKFSEKFHNRLHREDKFPWGVIPQLVIIFFVILAILFP